MNDRARMMMFVCGLDDGIIYLYQTQSLLLAPSVCRSRSLMGGDLLVLCVSSLQAHEPIEHERGLWMLKDVVMFQ